MKYLNKKQCFGKVFREKSGMVITLLLLVLTCCFTALFPIESVNVSASVSENSQLKCHGYQVDMTVNTDRTVSVHERIEMEFLTAYNAYGEPLTMFYKSFPKDCIYTNVVASCEGNEEFYFYVDDNPDYGEFVDVCCVGGVSKGARWTYDFSYTMELAGNDVENGMRLDVVGTGSPFSLNDVTVTMRFPEKPQSCIRYTGGYGDASKEELTGWSADGKTLVVHEDKLNLVYNDEFGEYMAEGITLEFAFADGVIDGYVSTKAVTPRTWLVLLLGAVALGVSVLLRFVGKNHGEIVSVVNIKAPDGMDPMQMGFLIDGTINDEDVTSIIYYFASKGYLTVDFSDEKDPVLVRVKTADGGYVCLPKDAPVYQKTLFDGLFKDGRERTSVSQLTNVYYESVDSAKLQLAMKKVPRYDKKSVACFLVSSLVSAFVCVLAPLLMSTFFVGGGYGSPSGFSVAIFIGIATLLLWAFKDLEFKKKSRTAVAVVLAVGYALAVLVFLAFFANHLLTGGEKLYLLAFSILAQIIGYGALSRTESYNKTLGDILGFKDFIVVTEEDKIKYMLEENPELYFDVLPYAQVLGVTNEWEGKFAKILLEPPHWATGYSLSTFDYLIITNSMCRVSRGMTSRPQSQSGTSVGRSGGGGFGGFSGGGRGGGGFGAR